MKLTAIAFVALAVGLAGVARAAEDGAALYASKCAACHGAKGQGAKFAPRPIAGMPATQVRKVLREHKGKMKAPPGVADEQSDAVAKYIAGMKK